MNRPILVCALFAASAAALVAQQASQANPYQGTSEPPPDDTITTTIPQAQTPIAKPRAGTPMTAVAPAAPARTYVAPAARANAYVAPALPANTYVAPANAYVAPALPAAAPSSAASNAAIPVMNQDGDIVQVAPDQQDQPQQATTAPVLNRRPVQQAYDPDGDIVHPAPPPPGTLGEGTMLRVHLLQRLSTAYNENGDTFRSQVASDVLQDGQVLIPAGAEIDGRVVHVSSGSFGGHGSMLLQPETVILPDGTRYRLYAQLTGTPGARAQVRSGEGTIVPDSRLKRDGIEYGGAIGAGAATGAMLAGPGGALAGTLIGAGAITAHLLVSHPQATLERGTTLIFALTEPLNLTREVASQGMQTNP